MTEPFTRACSPSLGGTFEWTPRMVHVTGVMPPPLPPLRGAALGGAPGGGDPPRVFPPRLDVLPDSDALPLLDLLVRPRCRIDLLRVDGAFKSLRLTVVAALRRERPGSLDSEP